LAETIAVLTDKDDKDDKGVKGERGILWAWEGRGQGRR
jgi:hypothetical protein